MPGETFYCQQCGGLGHGFGNKICPACLGVGHGFVLGGKLAYWRMNLSKDEFVRQKMEDLVQSALRLAAFVFSLFGVLYAIIRIIIQISVFGQSQGFSALGELGQIVFWTSVLAALYVYSSLERDLAQTRLIPRPRRDQSGLPVSSARQLIDQRQTINIAKTLSPEARKVVRQAFDLAAKTGRSIGGLHLFFAFLKNDDVKTIMARLGVNLSEVAGKIARAVAQQKTKQGTADIELIFFYAYQRALAFQQSSIDAVTLFVGVAAVDLTVREILYDVQVNETKVNNVLAWHLSAKRQYNQWRYWRSRAWYRPSNRLDRAMTAVATPVLDAFSVDVTELAQWGRFISTVSRSAVTDRVMRIFQGGHNAILVGYPGVGKRGIIEELGERMAADDVPDILKDKRLVSVSIAKLVSGVTPAEAEARLLRLLDEASYSRNIVLVIEEIQGAVGITSGQSGSVDMAQVLTKALHHSVTLCLATITPDDYRRVVERSALAGIFEKVILDEPTIDEAIQIVESRIWPVETKYKIFFSYDAIARLVELSAKYIYDRYLPQKALSLLDELALFVQDKRGQNIILMTFDVEDFFSQKLSIPVSRVKENEAQILLHFEDLLHQRIVDQEAAVKAVSEALRRARAEVRDQKRPIANLLFLGPTGVGKTELAKAVAEVYFGDQSKMVRLDMTEYQELTSLSRLIGSAAGGAGRGILTEAVRANPFTLLLLDELEKAHSDVINIFLQVMDDARLTDSRGQTTDFTNVILIATSNAGTPFIQAAVRAGKSMPEIERGLLENELKKNFQPEFLNRFDNIIIFRPLSEEHVLAITRLMLKKVGERLDSQGVALSASAEAVAELAAAGFDPSFGARPLRRVIQEKVDSPIARLILGGSLRRRDRITLESGGRITVKKAEQL